MPEAACGPLCDSNSQNGSVSPVTNAAVVVPICFFPVHSCIRAFGAFGAFGPFAILRSILTVKTEFRDRLEYEVKG